MRGKPASIFLRATFLAVARGPVFSGRSLPDCSYAFSFLGVQERKRFAKERRRQRKPFGKGFLWTLSKNRGAAAPQTLWGFKRVRVKHRAQAFPRGPIPPIRGKCPEGTKRVGTGGPAKRGRMRDREQSPFASQYDSAPRPSSASLRSAPSPKGRQGCVRFPEPSKGSPCGKGSWRRKASEGIERRSPDAVGMFHCPLHNPSVSFADSSLYTKEPLVRCFFNSI